MKVEWGVLLVFFSLSCSSTQKTSLSSEKPIENKKPQFSLPVSLSFNDNPPHDSVVQRVTIFFNEKKIQVITEDKVLHLAQAEYSRSAQSANIKWGADAKEILREVERDTRYVANLIRIDFSFVDYASKQFKLKWYNELMPMKIMTYKKGEWIQVDSNLVAKYSWPESLKIAVESIISSGKLQ